MSNAASQPESGRIRQMRQAYRLTKKTDPNLGLILLLTFIIFGGGAAVLAMLTFGTSTFGIVVTALFGVLVGILGTLIIFGRRAEKSAYLQIEDQPGAAAGALQMLKRGWDVKPAVAVTKNQDVVHRVIGRPGVILVGEGNPTRVAQLLGTEKKKHGRVVGEEIPVLDIVVGRGDGQVQLAKLNKHVRKMKKTIKPAQMTEAVNKMKALDAMRPPVPMPRGPMNANSMRGARKALRG